MYASHFNWLQVSFRRTSLSSTGFESRKGERFPRAQGRRYLPVSASILLYFESLILNPTLGCVTANCRMRSSACDTLIRFCARHVLCWPAFPLVPALRSPGSAATFPADASAVDFFALFAGFTATMAGSDFSCPCILVYGSSPSPCGPPYLAHTRQRRPDRRYPRFRYDPFARDVALDPGRASAPRMAMPHMLPSSE